MASLEKGAGDRPDGGMLLAAVSLDRIVLGAALIVAFSVGLAAVLTAVSLSLSTRTAF